MKQSNKRMLLLLSIITLSCSNDDTDLKYPYEYICGRDNGTDLKREPVYRIRVPESWKRRDPIELESISDTKKPLCEFLIKEADDEIRITIHNFPVYDPESQIPLTAQITRWKNQFANLTPECTKISPQSFNGYYGYLFEAAGDLNGKNSAVMAWALQLAPQHFRMIKELTQSASDVTIKAVGNADAIQKHRDDIISIARSFELIREIPSDL